MAELLLRKQEIRWCFVFPSHLLSGSALPCETGNPEIASLHVNTVCCFANEHTTHSNYNLVAVELPFIPKLIVYMHQTNKTYLEREHSILLSVAHMLYVYKVCHNVGRCVKDVVLRQAWSESQWTAVMEYLTISTNVRRYQTNHRWHLFSFRKTAHWCICIVHAPQSNCCGDLNFHSPEPCPQ